MIWALVSQLTKDLRYSSAGTVQQTLGRSLNFVAVIVRSPMMTETPRGGVLFQVSKGNRRLLIDPS